MSDEQEYYGTTPIEVDIGEKIKQIKKENRPYVVRVTIRVCKYIASVLYWDYVIITKFIKWVILCSMFVATIVGAVVGTDVKSLLDEYCYEEAA